MDVQVQGSLVGGPLSKKHIQSVAIVRKYARYVIELNAQGYVRKIRGNRKAALNIVAVTMPYAGPNTKHVVVLEIGLGKHRPYTRTRECLARLQYRVLNSEELVRVLPTLESILDNRRVAVMAGWKVTTPMWVKQDPSHWRKFERGIFISVAVHDQALYHALCGADLEIRRVTYALDYYAYLVRFWLKGYKKEVYTRAEMRRMKDLWKAVDMVKRACGPFVERFYVGKHARLLSLAVGRELTGEIPPYLPLTKISARYLNPLRREPKGKVRKKRSNGIGHFEVLPLGTKEFMRMTGELPALHRPPPEGITPEWEEWIEKKRADRYKEVCAEHAMPTD